MKYTFKGIKIDFPANHAEGKTKEQYIAAHGNMGAWMQERPKDATEDWKEDAKWTAERRTAIGEVYDLLTPAKEATTNGTAPVAKSAKAV